MTHAPGTAGNLPRLTALRAFAAAGVFLFHADAFLGLPGSALMRTGYSGVGFFFVLSGFVLTWSWRGGSRRDFWRRRFARIYPSHLVMVAVSLAVPVATGATAIGAVGLTLVLGQAWSPRIADIYGPNSVSWSLSSEAAFYAALPLLLPVMLAVEPRRRIAAAAAYLVLASAFVVVAATAVTELAQTAYVNPLIRGAEFAAGVVLAIELKNGRRSPLGVTAAAAVTAAATAVVWVAEPPFPTADVLLAPAFCLLVAAAATADRDGRPGPLTARGLVYLGEVSFAFYLVHELVLVNLLHALDEPIVANAHPFSAAEGLSLTAAALAMGLVGAALLHHGVERPAQSALTGIRLRGPATRRVGTS